LKLVVRVHLLLFIETQPINKVRLIFAALSRNSPILEVVMKFRPVIFAVISATILCVLTAASAKAQSEIVAGQYACKEATVAGKSVPCTVAPLSLKPDGHFELQGREGEYLVSGNWVELNGTILKSRAKIESGHKIVFRFYNKKGLCEMIYERRVTELGKTKLS
jgi:hypothetical protein